MAIGSDRDFEAQVDADTLVRAREIEGDPERLEKAKRAARRRRDELAKVTDDDERSALEKGFTRIG